VIEVLLVLRLPVDPLAGGPGQPFDPRIQPFDAFDLIVDQQSRGR
jgi:hypothetical protein